MCDKPHLFAADSSKKSQASVDIIPDTIRKRRSITVKEKLDILNMVDSGQKLSAVAREFGISSSTASTIVKERHKIKLLSDHYNIDPERKRMRLGIYRDVDEAVHMWFRQMRMKSIPINGPMLQQKAREFALQLGHQNFEGSSGWLFRFRERHGLSVKTMRVNDDSNAYNCTGVGMTDDEIVTSVSQNTVHSLNFSDKDKNVSKHDVPENYLVPEIELSEPIKALDNVAVKTEYKDNGCMGYNDSGHTEYQSESLEYDSGHIEYDSGHIEFDSGLTELNNSGSTLTVQDAVTLAEKLTSFLKEHNVPIHVLKSMNIVSDFIESDLREQLKQRKITDYFKR